MADTLRVDIVILGSGPGGYAAAISASKKGLSAVVVEMSSPGGVCLNSGCMPTKALYHSARIAENIRNAGSYGIETPPPELNFKKTMARKDLIVENLTKGLVSDLDKNNVKLIKGKGEIIGKGRVLVKDPGSGNTEIVAENIIVATGSSAAGVEPFEFSGDEIMDNTGILTLKKMPESLLIIGGGAVGCEYANIFSSFGSRVTIVEALSRILSMEDRETSDVVQEVFKKRGVNIFTESKVEGCEKGSKNFICTIGEGHKISAEKILISVGRKPNSTGIGLEKAGIEVESNGYIKVDPYLRTNIDNIYAIGDVTGGFQYAHVASREGEAAVENIAGGEEEMSYDVIPRAVFTSPEIGAVGLTENQAKEKNESVCTGVFPFSSSGKAYIAGETEGFIKIIADSKTGGILGAQIVGPRASDLVHEVAVAMRGELLIDDLASTVHTHPTFSEAVMEAAKKCSESIESK